MTCLSSVCPSMCIPLITFQPTGRILLLLLLSCIPLEGGKYTISPCCKEIRRIIIFRTSCFILEMSYNGYD
jgi:hypothetical protein